MLIAALAGTGPVADAFFVALRVPNLFRRLFGEGAFNAAFVPEFSGILATEGRRPARQFAEEAIAVLAFWLLLLTVAGRDLHAAAHARAGAGLRGRARQGGADGRPGADHLPLRAADLPGRAAVRAC